MMTQCFGPTRLEISGLLLYNRKMTIEKVCDIMIKLFVTDLDGTLLNRWHMADKTINSGVKQVKSRDYLFAVATGRHLRRHQRMGLSFLKDTDYFICMNGSLVLDNKGQVIHQTLIAPDQVQALIQAFPAISFEVLTKDGIHVLSTARDHFRKGYQGNLTAKNLSRASLNRLLGGFFYQKSLDQISQLQVLKLECITNRPEDKLALIDYLESNKDTLSYAYNDQVHFEITASGANKQEGVLHLIKHLGLHPDQVAVYGNDTNDVEMLAYFTHSYAVEDAKEPAKAAAKTVLPDLGQTSVIGHMLETVKHQDAYR